LTNGVQAYNRLMTTFCNSRHNMSRVTASGHDSDSNAASRTFASLTSIL